MRLTFDPLTIQHLGFRMYSQLPNALAELIANAYDADATEVTIRINEAGVPGVRVVDDGHGMSDQDLQERYLTIGRNRVSAGEERSESGRRRAAGRKGLGKLAPFGVGNKVVVETKRQGVPQWTRVEMNWDAMVHSAGSYEPVVTHRPGLPDEHGTSVDVQDLKRKSPIDPSVLAGSLARLFDYIDSGFAVHVESPTLAMPVAVTRELRYAGIEKETTWRIPEDVVVEAGNELPGVVTGEILASRSPLPTHMRGVTLYVNGRLANDPEFYGASESSYATAYLTGHINADFLDELAEDVIATDRRSVSWEAEVPALLRDYLGAVLRRVAVLRRQTRKQAQHERLKNELNVDPDAWASTIRGPEADAVAKVLDVLVSPDSDIADGDRATVVEGLRKIAPEYADLHWRQLHPSLQQACAEEYKDEHYHAAVVEATKQFVQDLRAASGIQGAENAVIDGSFAGNTPKVDVVQAWRGVLSTSTIENIQKGQHAMSQAIWAGFRNPIQHELRIQLETSGAFTYQDCLDALSILSHLRRRVDGAAP